MSNNLHILKELFGTICDEELSEGIARKVYASKVWPNVVFKVEEGARSFQNATEWETWQHIKDTEFSGWFAPCQTISPCGSVLVQMRTIPAREGEYPEKMPAFFTDLKRANFGILNGRLVCHDYGITLLMETGMTKRMRKADWWG